MSSLPICQTLLLEPHNGVLHITLNRPESRNAMSLQMVTELRAVLADTSVPAAISRTWPVPVLMARMLTGN